MAITKKKEEDFPFAIVDGKAIMDCEELDLYYEDDEDNTFHIGQCYETQAARLLRCKKCNSSEFNVGAGNYFTALRCVNCEWEVCIHDG